MQDFDMYLTVRGEEWYIDLTYDNVTGSWDSDGGIGHYEWHGATGYDEDGEPYFVPEDCDIPEISIYGNCWSAGGELAFEILTNHGLIDKVKEAIFEYHDEPVPEPDGDPGY